MIHSIIFVNVTIGIASHVPGLVELRMATRSGVSATSTHEPLAHFVLRLQCRKRGSFRAVEKREWGTTERRAPLGGQ